MTSEPDAVLTVDKLAEYPRIAKSMIYKLAHRGRIPPQQVGRHWRFQKAAIDRWLERPCGTAPVSSEGKEG